jgi:hypothetical protein
LSLAFSALIVAGCTTAATRVTIEPSPVRPEAQVRADGARCAEAASAVTTSRESVRDREYAACLLAEGYRITMPFLAGVEHARLTLSSPTARSATTVAADIAACQDAASAGRVRAADVVAGQFGGSRTGDSVQVRPHTSDSPELANQLVSCLGQRCYDARR